MEDMEKGNKQLIAILEKYDDKMEKLKEQVQIQQLKMTKYEEMKTGKVKKIDTDTLDGRVSFLVNILEEYKKQLEDMEEEEEESEKELYISSSGKKRKRKTKPDKNSDILEALRKKIQEAEPDSSLLDSSCQENESDNDVLLDRQFSF